MLDADGEDERSTTRSLDEFSAFGVRVQMREFLPVLEEVSNEGYVAHDFAEHPFVVVTADRSNSGEIREGSTAVAERLHDEPVFDELLVGAYDFEHLEEIPERLTVVAGRGRREAKNDRRLVVFEER